MGTLSHYHIDPRRCGDCDCLHGDTRGRPRLQLLEVEVLAKGAAFLCKHATIPQYPIPRHLQTHAYLVSDKFFQSQAERLRRLKVTSCPRANLTTQVTTLTTASTISRHALLNPTCIIPREIHCSPRNCAPGLASQAPAARGPPAQRTPAPHNPSSTPSQTIRSCGAPRRCGSHQIRISGPSGGKHR